MPIIYINGLIFLTTVLGYMGGSALSAKLAGKHDSESLMLIGSAIALAATVTMGAASALYPKSIYALMLPMTFFTTALGMVLPPSPRFAIHVSFNKILSIFNNKCAVRESLRIGFSFMRSTSSVHS